MSAEGSYDPWFEAIYSGKNPEIVPDIYSPFDIVRNLVKNHFDLKRYHGPCSEFKDKDFNEYYISKDEELLVRLSDREGAAIRTEDYVLEFTDLSTFIEKLNEELEGRLEEGDIDNLDVREMALDEVKK